MKNKLKEVLRQKMCQPLNYQENRHRAQYNLQHRERQGNCISGLEAKDC